MLGQAEIKQLSQKQDETQPCFFLSQGGAEMPLPVWETILPKQGLKVTLKERLTVERGKG